VSHGTNSVLRTEWSIQRFRGRSLCACRGSAGPAGRGGAASADSALPGSGKGAQMLHSGAGVAWQLLGGGRSPHVAAGSAGGFRVRPAASTSLGVRHHELRHLPVLIAAAQGGTQGCGTQGCGTQECGTQGCGTQGCGTQGCGTQGCGAGAGRLCLAAAGDAAPRRASFTASQQLRRAASLAAAGGRQLPPRQHQPLPPTCRLAGTAEW